MEPKVGKKCYVYRDTREYPDYVMGTLRNIVMYLMLKCNNFLVNSYIAKKNNRTKMYLNHL